MAIITTSLSQVAISNGVRVEIRTQIAITVIIKIVTTIRSSLPVVVTAATQHRLEVDTLTNNIIVLMKVTKVIKNILTKIMKTVTKIASSIATQAQPPTTIIIVVVIAAAAAAVVVVVIVIPMRKRNR